MHKFSTVWGEGAMPQLTHCLMVKCSYIVIIETDSNRGDDTSFLLGHHHEREGCESLIHKAAILILDIFNF